MSSLRVRTKNKLMWALGAAKPSTNAAFDLAYSDFESTLQRLETLDSTLKTYIASIKTFHSVASLVVGAIDGLSSGGSGTASYEQKPVGVSEMQQFAGDARVACADVDMTVLQDTYGRLEQEVLIPVKGWLLHARNLQNEAKAFQKQKALYDHYSRKVTALREAHEERASTGRREKAKNTERMFRNEQKLATTTQEYVRQLDTVIRDLRAFVVSRDAALAPLLRRVLRGRAIYAKRMHEAMGRISALVEDDVEEIEDDGVLGQYMTVAQNAGRVGSAATIRASTSPSLAYCTVCKALFEEYEGQVSRHASTHHVTHKFATVSPFETEKQTHEGYGVSESLYLSPRRFLQFMTANVSTNNATNRSLGDKLPASEVSKMPANVLSPSSVTMATNDWDACPTASAPSADLFSSGEWSLNQEGSWQQQVPVGNFQDMHRNALSGEISFFR